MKNPYMPARMRPSAGLPEPFIKNETVIGTIGKTQGGSGGRRSPHRMASMISPHSEPPPAASFCAVRGDFGRRDGFR